MRAPPPATIPAFAGMMAQRSRPLQVELDALCQRQRIGVIDRVGLPAHVGPPCIGTRLATAARLLFAAERAADLRTGGADVDVRDAAVRTGGREEGLGRLE